MIPPKPGKIVQKGECLLWVEGCAPNPKGYVKSTENGVRDYVHRHAWRKAYGEIPEGMSVCHTCDTPNCVNPKHLFLGDNFANMQDAAKKGRVSTQRLRPEQVKEIRRRRAAGEGRAALAAEFGVTYQNVNRIVKRETWRFIDE